MKCEEYKYESFAQVADQGGDPAINPNKLYREKERWILGKPKSRYRRDSWGGGWGPENVRERPNLFHLECKSEGSCHLHKLVNC